VSEAVAVLIAVGMVGLFLWAVRRTRDRREIQDRLFGDVPGRLPPIRRRSRARETVAVLSLAVGIGAGLITCEVLGWGMAFALAFGILCGVLVLLGAGFFTGRRSVRLQAQLADAIDMMVGSLQAGAGLLEALQSAGREARRPLRRYFEALLVRIQIGENPVTACQMLAAAATLEPFRLFYSTLAVQWESGGSVAPVLSDVGHFARDHLDTLRRVRAQMAEVRVSVLGVLGLTYVIGLVMWRAYPERMEGFLSLEVGRAAAAFALALQALGTFWIYRMSRIRY
jgi:Flp pilus assembly protein TadB